MLLLKLLLMGFSFWNILFLYSRFSTMQMKKVMTTSEIIPLKPLKYWIKYISRNIQWSSVLQIWQQKCISHKNQNDTYYVVAMATILALVFLCEKPNTVPIWNLLKWDKGSCSEYVVWWVLSYETSDILPLGMIQESLYCLQVWWCSFLAAFMLLYAVSTV